MNTLTAVLLILLIVIGGFLLFRRIVHEKIEPPKGNCPICGISLSCRPAFYRVAVDGQEHAICDYCGPALEKHPEYMERLKAHPEWDLKVEGTNADEVASVMKQAVFAISGQNTSAACVQSSIPNSNEPGDVFISYAREDQPVASVLANSLKNRDVSVWWDPRIPLGNSFDQVIEQALNSALCVIVLWSKHSALSDWVKAEASEGKRRGILVPAQIDHAEIPLEFRRMQTADLKKWDGATNHSGWNQLYESVERLIKTHSRGEQPQPKI